DSPAPPDHDSRGPDVFGATDGDGAQHGIASSSQQTRQALPVFAFTLVAGGAVPLPSPGLVAGVSMPVPASVVEHAFATLGVSHARSVESAGVQEDWNYGEEDFAFPESASGVAPSTVELDAFFASAN